jgi:hypothetical protein
MSIVSSFYLPLCHAPLLSLHGHNCVVFQQGQTECRSSWLLDGDRKLMKNGHRTDGARPKKNLWAKKNIRIRTTRGCITAHQHFNRICSLLENLIKITVTRLYNQVLEIERVEHSTQHFPVKHKGLCAAALSNHVFDYGQKGAADQMRTT